MGWFTDIAKNAASNIADIARKTSSNIGSVVREARDLYEFITDGGIDTDGRSNNTTIDDMDKIISSAKKQEPVISTALSKKADTTLKANASHAKDIDTLVVVAPATLMPGTKKEMSQQISFSPKILPELLRNPQVIKILGINKSVLDKLTASPSLTNTNNKSLATTAKQLGLKADKEGRFIVTITGTDKQIKSALEIFSQAASEAANRITAHNKKALAQGSKNASIEGNSIKTKMLTHVPEPILMTPNMPEVNKPTKEQTQAAKETKSEKNKPWYVKAYNWVRDKVKKWIIEPLKSLSKSSSSLKEDNLLHSKPQEGLLDYKELANRAKDNQPSKIQEPKTRMASAKEEKENINLRDANMSFKDLHNFMSPIFEEEQSKKAPEPNKATKQEAKIEQNTASKQSKSGKASNSQTKSNKQPPTSSKESLSDELRKEARRAARSARRSAKSASKIDIKEHDKEIYRMHNTGFHTGKGPGHRR